MKIPALFFLCCACAAHLAGADGEKIPKSERREMRKPDGGKPDAKPAAPEAQARALSRLRERLEITDDAAWSVVAERIARVDELRRAAGGAVPAAAADRGKRADRMEGAGGEREALRAAVTDRLPDAEVRSRLARLAEVQRQNTAKLARAHEELRAVLTVRQEAIAVMFGILPP
jgi:hypothetical protein